MKTLAESLASLESTRSELRSRSQESLAATLRLASTCAELAAVTRRLQAIRTKTA